MSPDLLELAQNYFLGSTVRQLSAAFDASEQQVRAVLPYVVPLALGVLLVRAEQPAGSTDVFGRVYRINRRAPLGSLPELLHELHDPAHPPYLLDGGLPVAGPGLLHAVLGSHYNPAVERISQQAGTPPGTVAKLLQLALPVLLGLLGRHATEHQLDARSLTTYLLSQRGLVAEALGGLPGGFAHYLPGLAATVVPAGSDSATTALPSHSVAAAPPLPAPARRPTPPPTEQAAAPAATHHRRWPWLLALLLAVVLALAAAQLYLLRRADKPAASPTTHAPSSVISGAHQEVATGSGAYLPGRTTLRLAGGAQLRVSNNSAEARLYRFLQDPTRTVSRDKTQDWLLLDQVYFMPSAATLTRASLVQLANLGAVLQTFPHAAIKLGGYTDDQSNATKNLLLSADCANAARKELLVRHIPPGRVAAQGYGSAPIRPASSASPTHGRRVYVRVTQKYGG